MRTVGVDLAADPARTGLCEIDWAAGTVTCTPRPIDDERIVAAIVGADTAGLDVPLGWPDAFVDALVAHRSGTGWPAADHEPAEGRRGLRFRVTDRRLMADGIRPLSVATDFLGIVAMRGARLQHLLTAEGVVVDRSGTTGKVVEAYPAAALRTWGHPASRYKGDEPGRPDARQALVAAVTARCGDKLAAAALGCLDGCDDHDLDAFLCAVVARAARLGLTSAPDNDADVAVARREGWIHLPTADVETISAG